jgi:hypothetical protein
MAYEAKNGTKSRLIGVRHTPDRLRLNNDCILKSSFVCLKAHFILTDTDQHCPGLVHLKADSKL